MDGFIHIQLMTVSEVARCFNAFFLFSGFLSETDLKTTKTFGSANNIAIVLSYPVGKRMRVGYFRLTKHGFDVIKVGS